MHVCMCACSGRKTSMEVTLHSDAALQGLDLSSEQGSYARQWYPVLLALMCQSLPASWTQHRRRQRFCGPAACSASLCGLKGR